MGIEQADFDMGVPEVPAHVEIVPLLDRPAQALYVMVHQGSGFPIRGRSAAVVSLLQGGTTVETTEQGSMTPLWNDVMRFPHCDLSSSVQITLWHHMPPTPAGAKHKVVMGRASVTLSRSILHGYTDDWVEIQLVSGGSCKLRISFSNDKAALDMLKRGLRPEWATRFRLIGKDGPSTKEWSNSPSRISIEKYALPMLKQF
eukprot:CAMPEP_0196722640 /NCGR_PEP_ID=MMETSP1091-20130531/4957_1 /TAXON_ID=302021 /ORGANISM="Rhodomonas sp., Strain CCMP768" /LENGTH=200 /DNA_ID=CAMNT_0042064389 /DNA_START=53 /DNA_END=655 /DNA_ORIENTATION=+